MSVSHKSIYGDEKEVGKSLHASGVPREEVLVRIKYLMYYSSSKDKRRLPQDLPVALSLSPLFSSLLTNRIHACVVFKRHSIPPPFLSTTAPLASSVTSPKFFASALSTPPYSSYPQMPPWCPLGLRG